MNLNHIKLAYCFDDGSDGLVFAAFRYYIGRTTIQAYMFSGQLAQAWPLISPNFQGLILRDLKEAFARDDFARQRGMEHFPLGHDEDRVGWQRVLDAPGVHVPRADREEAND